MIVSLIQINKLYMRLVEVYFFYVFLPIPLFLLPPLLLFFLSSFLLLSLLLQLLQLQPLQVPLLNGHVTKVFAGVERHLKGVKNVFFVFVLDLSNLT